MKNLIRKYLENPVNKRVLRFSGVYRIRNKYTGKAYVGSTSRSFQQRLTEHLDSLDAGTHSNPILQNSYTYRPSSFSFDILEGHEPGSKSSDEIIEREQHWINTLEPKFNVNKDADYRKPFIRKEKESYTVIDDLGVTHTFTAVEPFIKEYLETREDYKLSARYLYKLVKGEKESYKGWVLADASSITKTNKTKG